MVTDLGTDAQSKYAAQRQYQLRRCQASRPTPSAGKHQLLKIAPRSGTRQRRQVQGGLGGLCFTL